MSIASRLGPWLLGTAREGAGRNMGATIVAQSKAIAFGDTTANAFVLPAGAMITGVSLLTTTAFTGGTTPTVTASINATAITNAVTLGAVGNTAATLGAVNATATGLVANVGTTDATVTYTVAGGPAAGAGLLVIQYIVRNPDGTYGVNA